MFSWVNLKLIEHVAPDSLHLFPILDDAVLHRVVQLNDTLVLLGFLANEKLVLF